MLRDRSCRAGVTPVHTRAALLQGTLAMWHCIRRRAALLHTVAVVLLFGAILLPAAHAQKQKTNGRDKPLPAKSNPTVFYTPEGQQQIADAILTDAVDQLWEQTDAHYHKGEYNHAINLSRIIVQGDPRNVEAFSDAAYLLWSTGRNDEATAFLKQGLAANSDSYYMYDELGSHFYFHLKDYPNAVTYYEQAVKYDCPFFTWSGLAHSYEKSNQWEKAVTAWEKAGNYVTDGKVSDTMKHNLARAKAELAKRQKQP